MGARLSNAMFPIHTTVSRPPDVVFCSAPLKSSHLGYLLRTVRDRLMRPLVIVPMLPGTQGLGGVCDAVERRVTPTRFFVDAMTALHLAVLFRPPRDDVTRADAGFLHG